MEIHNENEQAEQGQRRYKIHNLWRKRAAGNAMLKPSLVLKDMSSLKKGLLLNGIKGVAHSRYDHHLAYPAVHKKKRPKEFLFLKSNNKEKLCKYNSRRGHISSPAGSISHVVLTLESSCEIFFFG